MKADTLYVALGLALLPIAAMANPYETRLANGMKVVVKEDKRAPVATAQVWYRAGSMDEFNGTTGVAHVLEHMMFKGTRSVPAGKFSERIAAAGGRENAFTSHDYTAYFQTLEKSRLELSFRLESDRMQNLVLSEAEFAKEIKVVMEERRLRTEDNPQALVSEQLSATAFTAHPYRNPVIGWMDDLDNLTVQDARDWYRRWYTPNNAILVVVGDVDHQAVFRLAQKYYGKARARALPERKPQQEPEQRGIRRITVKAPAKLPFLLMGYHAPVVREPEKDWEPYALEMLAGVLDGNPAARLNKSLVRESRIATDAGAGFDAISRGPGLFLLEGTPSEGKSVAELEAALRAEVEKIKQHGVAEEELVRVRSQLVASRVFQQDSIFYQAMQIGQLEATGFSHRVKDVRLKKLQEVTPEQVREVAKKYLVDDRLTVAVLDPQPLEEKKPVMKKMGGRHGG